MSTSTAPSCLGCGKNIGEDRGKRLLHSESSKHVVPLWSSLFGDELRSRGKNLDVLGLVEHEGGRVCRRCFSALDRCTKLLDTVRAGITKAVDANEAVPTTSSSSSLRIGIPPPTFSVPVTTSCSPSPEVMVSILV